MQGLRSEHFCGPTASRPVCGLLTTESLFFLTQEPGLRVFCCARSFFSCGEKSSSGLWDISDSFSCVSWLFPLSDATAGDHSWSSVLFLFFFLPLGERNDLMSCCLSFSNYRNRDKSLIITFNTNFKDPTQEDDCVSGFTHVSKIHCFLFLPCVPGQWQHHLTW